MSNTRLGVQDFLTMTDEFHPEWSVFAVEASIEQVREALLGFPQSREPDRNVAAHLQTVDGSLEDKLQGQEFSYVVPIVQVSNSPWVILYWEVFYGGRTAADWAKSLSAQLSTRTVMLFSADTAGVLGYALFDRGDHLEEAQCCPQAGEGFYWKSRLRPEPELELLDALDDDFEGDDDEYEQEEERISNHNEAVWRNFINAVFSEYGIYLPAFYPVSQRGSVHIEVEPASEQAMEYIDLLYPVQNW